MNNYLEILMNELNNIGISTKLLSNNMIAFSGRFKSIPFLTVGISFAEGDIYDVTILSHIMSVGSDISNSLSVCNKLNNKYKLAKFYIDDNLISCIVSTSFYEDTFLSEAMYLIRSFIEILDESYKELLLSTLD